MTPAEIAITLTPDEWRELAIAQANDADSGVHVVGSHENAWRSIVARGLANSSRSWNVELLTDLGRAVLATRSAKP